MMGSRFDPRPKIAFAAPAAGAQLLLAACATTTGSGTGPSRIQPGATATFGFQLQCSQTTNTFSAQVQCQDHGTSEQYPNGVSVHGTDPGTSIASLDIPGVTTCAQLDAFVAQNLLLPPGTEVFAGSYTPQTTTPEPGGEFFVFVARNGAFPEGCPSGAAAFDLLLEGGYYSGYSNGFCLTQGDITIHQASPGSRWPGHGAWVAFQS